MSRAAALLTIICCVVAAAGAVVRNETNVSHVLTVAEDHAREISETRTHVGDLRADVEVLKADRGYAEDRFRGLKEDMGSVNARLLQIMIRLGVEDPVRAH